MMDNIDNIQKYILNHVANYEQEKRGEIDLHEKMLRYLEAPYEKLPQHERIHEILKQKLSEEEVRAWFAFPDFDYRSQPRLVEELCAEADDPDSFRRAAQGLIDKGFLSQAPRSDGQLGYMRIYMLYLVFNAILTNDHDPLTDALIDWWMHLLKDSAHLRTIHAEHRVLPHEGSLPDGHKLSLPDQNGKVIMNLDIPDTREVLPTDMSDAVLRGVDCMAVIDCICRAATEARGVRACDYPIKEVCFLFNEAAREAIQVGYGRQISNEEGIQLMHQLRDMGLVQVISNAYRPLSMCNCCSCCCICLNTMARNEDCLATPSRFIAEITRGDNCVGCGRCAAICQMSAIDMTNGVALDGTKCIGCGQCVVQCPGNVIDMKLRPGAPDKLPVDKTNRIYL